VVLLLADAGRVLMLRVAELVPQHPNRRNKKPGQKTDVGASSSASTSAAGGGKQSSNKKKGKKK